MPFILNEEKGTYDVNGVEVPKAAFDSIHSEGAAGTNRRVKQMFSAIYPDTDPKEIERMQIKDIAEFIQKDREGLLKKADRPPEPQKKKDDPPAFDEKLVRAQIEQDLAKKYAQQEADLKRRAAINDLRTEAIGLGLRDDLRDPEVFSAFVKRRFNIDDQSLSGEKVRWLDPQKDQVVMGPDGKEADARQLAKMLAQAEANSFVTRKTSPHIGKPTPGTGPVDWANTPTDSLLAASE